MKKKTYYVDDNDWVYCESDGKLYIYNYEKKSFILIDLAIDDMSFHEIPENEAKKFIKNNEYLFK